SCPIGDVVPVLDRYHVDDAAGDPQLLEADIADADVAHQARMLQVPEHLDGLRVWHLPVRGVHLIQVDSLQPKPAQAALDGLADVLGTAVGLPAVGPRPGETRLRGNDQVVGIRVERLRDQLFADVRAVRVGG